MVKQELIPGPYLHLSYARITPTKHKETLQQQVEDQQKTIDRLLSMVPSEKLQEAQI